MSTAITAEGLAKQYRIGQYRQAYGTLRDSLVHAAKLLARREHVAETRDIWALQDVSFDVQEGEVLGVIGRNGAGKSTLLKILTRITSPTAGRAEIRGRVGSLLEVGTGFHPELTGRENIYLNGSILGMKRREIAGKLPEIIEFSGIEKFLDTPVKRYSSGMYVRLAFSVAAHLEPEILLVDEVLAVGDAEFQRRCLGRMEEYGTSGRTVVFVSHNMPAVSRLCERVILLSGGTIAMDGPAEEVVAHYLHTETGTASWRRWEGTDSPGNDLVRLRGARVVDSDGGIVDASDVRQPVGIEIGFDVLRLGEPVFAQIKLLDQRGDIAFNALDSRPEWRVPSAPGSYVVTAWLPGNLLNEGLYTVNIAVCTAGAKLIHHAGVVEAVSFTVYDPAEGDSSRGSFTGPLRGPVRPLLEWTTASD